VVKTNVKLESLDADLASRDYNYPYTPYIVDTFVNSNFELKSLWVGPTNEAKLLHLNLQPVEI